MCPKKVIILETIHQNCVQTINVKPNTSHKRETDTNKSCLKKFLYHRKKLSSPRIFSTKFCFKNSYKSNIILHAWKIIHKNWLIRLYYTTFFSTYKKGATCQTLTNRPKAFFFCALGSKASVSDWAALLNSTCTNYNHHISTCEKEKYIIQWLMIR